MITTETRFEILATLLALLAGHQAVLADDDVAGAIGRCREELEAIRGALGAS